MTMNFVLPATMAMTESFSCLTGVELVFLCQIKVPFMVPTNGGDFSLEVIATLAMFVIPIYIECV